MKKSFLQVLTSSLKRMISCAKGSFALSVLLCALDAAFSLGYTVLFQYVIDCLEQSLNLTLAFSAVLWVFGGFVLLVLLQDINNGLMNFQLSRQRFKVQGALHQQLLAKAASAPALTWEEPKNLDMLNKAKEGMEDNVSVLIYTELLLGSSLLYILMISYYLFTIHPLLALIILAFVLPTLGSYVLKNKYRHAAEEQLAAPRRRMNAAEDAICKRQYFKETRHLGATPFFLSELKKAAAAFTKIKNREFQRSDLISFLVNLSSFFGFLVSLLAVIALAWQGKITIGEIAAILATVKIINQNLDEMFGRQVAGIATAYTSLRNLSAMLDADFSQEPAEDLGEFESLKLENVRFCYPNAPRNALDGVSFELHAGETVCVVGENGSGKTTLSKILLGLYPATQGKVELNGKAIGPKNLKDLQQSASAVFQNYNRYALTLEENLRFGDTATSDGRAEGILRRYGIDELAQQLPQGYDTMLSKEFDGVDLSGGQWQRVAIGRGALKKGALLVMDEPTSAIDPLLEHDLLTQMLNADSHATKVIITHRIGIATQADRVIVMHGGKIVEMGSHAELMAQNGTYAQLFQNQSVWYQ